MREAEDVRQPCNLPDTDVAGLTAEGRAEIVGRAGEDLRRGRRATCRIVSFVTGRRRPTKRCPRASRERPPPPSSGATGPRRTRPTCSTPWRGSTATASPWMRRCRSPARTAGSKRGRSPAGSGTGWNRWPSGRMATGSRSCTRSSSPRRPRHSARPGGVAERDLMPGFGWRWEDLDDRIRLAATGARDPFTFGHLFSQVVRVELRLTRDGMPGEAAGPDSTSATCGARLVVRADRRAARDPGHPEAGGGGGRRGPGPCVRPVTRCCGSARTRPRCTRGPWWQTSSTSSNTWPIRAG